MTAISIRELHEQTDLWVRTATEQEPVVVTDNGTAVAKIVPIGRANTDNPFQNRRLLPGFSELQARLTGGTPRNALGGRPTALLASEVDLGARFSGLFGGTRLVLGVEGGVLFPGGGLTGPGGLGEDAIWGGRVLATYEL